MKRSSTEKFLDTMRFIKAVLCFIKELFSKCCIKWVCLHSLSVLEALYVSFPFFSIGSHQVVCYHGNLAWQNWHWHLLERTDRKSVPLYSMLTHFCTLCSSDNRQFLCLLFFFLFLSRCNQGSFDCKIGLPGSQTVLLWLL